MDNSTTLDFNNNTEEDLYAKEILRMAEDIIEDRNYSTLCQILKNYDFYVKKAINNKDFTLPFWCYCFGYNSENQEV